MTQQEFSRRLDEFLDAYNAEHGTTGYFRVTKKGELYYEKKLGFANKEERVPFTPESRFNFYSISKAFCSLGLLRLWEDGRLDFDVHPKVYVPEAEKLHPALTLRNMLLHVSGMPDFNQTPGVEKYGPGTPDRLRAVVSHLHEFPHFFEPETGMRYTNPPFAIGTMVIENLTGMAYEDYMQKEVFEPLGSETLTVHMPGKEIPYRVMGYELAKDGTVYPVLPNCEWMRGAGDVLGTADDVYLLHRVVTEGLLFRKKETLDQLFSRLPAGDFSFGCRRVPWHGKDRILHNGGSTGFRTYHQHLPQDDDLDIIILSNSGWGDARRQISEEIFRLYFGTETEAEKIELDKGYIK
ncbi:MAG: beta-lactamase family protein [Clostridia bacterium]|nr:beta-lactamase family protein [Clostridia bacterium]